MKTPKTITYGEVMVKIISLRETITDEAQRHMDCPANCVEYWRSHIATAPGFDSERECLIVLILDSKMKIKGHHLVSLGLINQTLVHAREVFRPAVALAGAFVVLMHNHPSGDPTPSHEDLKSTRDMANAGRILGITLLDHVVVGQPSQANARGFVSLKESGMMTI